MERVGEKFLRAALIAVLTILLTILSCLQNLIQGNATGLQRT